MTGDHSTKPPSNGSLLLLLQAMNGRDDSMDRRIQTIETILMQGLWSRESQPETAKPESLWSRLKAAVTVASLAYKVWQVIRLVPWVGLGIQAYKLLLRWLGLV